MRHPRHFTILVGEFALALGPLHLVPAAAGTRIILVVRGGVLVQTAAQGVVAIQQLLLQATRRVPRLRLRQLFTLMPDHFTVQTIARVGQQFMLVMVMPSKWLQP